LGIEDADYAELRVEAREACREVIEMFGLRSTASA
jgi:hypothetical protein